MLGVGAGAGVLRCQSKSDQLEGEPVVLHGQTPFLKG